MKHASFSGCRKTCDFLTCALAVALIVLPGFGASPVDAAMRGTVSSRDGMVSSAHPLASMVGVSVLQRGGNAMDASIAMAAVLNVTDPSMTGIGGDMFLLYYSAKDGKVHALNAGGRAPAAATMERIRAMGHNQIPAFSGLAVSVPGALDGWTMALARFGTMKLADLLQPAIHYAERGFPVYKTLVGYYRGFGSKSLALYPDSIRTYFIDGKQPRLGEPLVQKDLAQSFRKIARGGKDVLYRGELGEKIVAAVQSAGGLLTMQDLAEHRSNWVEPVATTYRGYTVVGFPPNTQGVALLQQLNILEGYDIKAMGSNSATLVHLQLETVKQAFADRDRYITDVERASVPTRGLISKAYAAQVRTRIDHDRASVAAPGDPAPHNTTYFAVVDKDGNAVSFINSLRNPFGSGITAGDTGVLLQNRAQDFSLDPNHVNRIEPGKRTMHTLNPAMVLKDGKLYMAIGCSGAHQQTQAIQQVLVNHFDFGMDLQDAIETPRWAIAGANVHVEERMPEEVRKALEAKGHKVVVGKTGFGGCHAVLVDPTTGVRFGGAESRGDSAALGY
jgi:gamma-glutamyltranspeptidase / glutathione hydrolase